MIIKIHINFVFNLIYRRDMLREEIVAIKTNEISIKPWNVIELADKPPKVNTGIKKLNKINCKKKSDGDLINFGETHMEARLNTNEAV